MRKYLRGGDEPESMCLPDFREWFNELPQFYTGGYTFDEIYEKDKALHDFLLRAYKSGKGLKITKVIK
jgi:hypothetical protein